MPIDQRFPVRFLPYMLASFVSAIVVVCCTGMTEAQAQRSRRSNHVAATSETTSETVLLVVRDACSNKFIPGVRVELISIRRGERRVLGRTDKFGGVCIPRGVLRNGDILLYCREGFFCGATDLSQYSVSEYDVFNVYLAQFRI